jgi:hypothetical protein
MLMDWHLERTYTSCLFSNGTGWEEVEIVDTLVCVNVCGEIDKRDKRVVMRVDGYLKEFVHFTHQIVRRTESYDTLGHPRKFISSMSKAHQRLLQTFMGSSSLIACILVLLSLGVHTRRVVKT